MTCTLCLSQPIVRVSATSTEDAKGRERTSFTLLNSINSVSQSHVPFDRFGDSSGGLVRVLSGSLKPASGRIGRPPAHGECRGCFTAGFTRRNTFDRNRGSVLPCCR